MARRRGSARRRRRGGSGFLYKLLSVLLICGCLVAAITLFFRVDTVVITGEKRYTEAEIREVSGVKDGDNLFLLNKYQVIRNIAEALPYVELEETRVQRKLPDTLLIEIKECGDPLAWAQDGTVWLVSPGGKIVEQRNTVGDYPTIDGCRLLAPSVGTLIALDTENDTRRQSLLELLAALIQLRQRFTLTAGNVDQQLLQLVPILCRSIFGCHQHTEHRLPSPVIRVMHGKDDLLHLE